MLKWIKFTLKPKLWTKKRKWSKLNLITFRCNEIIRCFMLIKLWAIICNLKVSVILFGYHRDLFRKFTYDYKTFWKLY